MKENAESTPPSEGDEVIPENEWSHHKWLCQLNSGSDVDGDDAWFFTAKSLPAPVETVGAIRIQYRSDQLDWTDAIRADGAFFPVHGDVPAVVGWYRPIWAMARPALYRGLEFRAIIPASDD